MSKSICAYPWAAAAIRPNGLILPCCKFDHRSEFGSVDDKDPRNSNMWNDLRSKMLAGEMLKNCESCYKEENSGVESLRQQSLNFYKPTDINPIKLKQLEISFNNLCNLACVQCSEEFSTKWYSEKVKHRKYSVTGIIQNNFDYLKWDLSEVRQLKIIGGEPLMAQDKFAEVLNQLDRKNLSVIVATNGTMLPNRELRTLLEECGHVSFKLSLDGVGSVNDWIRWPSKFDKIENTIDTLESWWGDKKNIKLGFHSVISIYNIFCLKELVDYINNRTKWKASWNWIRYPSWQSLSVVLNKDQLKQELYLLSNQYATLSVNPFKVSIDRLADAPQASWDDFKFENKRLEQERNMLSPVNWS